MSGPDPTRTLPPGDATASYESSDVRPAVPRVAPRQGGGEPSEELRDTLRQRLLLLAIIGVCVGGVMVAILTPFFIRDGSWEALVCFWVLFLLPTGVVLTLRRWRQISVRALRIIELTAVAVLTGILVWSIFFNLFVMRHGSVFAQLSEGPFTVLQRPMPWEKKEPLRYTYRYFTYTMWAIGGWHTFGWVLLIVGYGIFIPNSRKRATVVILTLAFIPVLLLGALCLLDPDISWYHAGIFMLATLGQLGFVTAVVLFGVHRIDALWREAMVARRLGQYQLKEQLGAGGMGEVYRAEHVLLRRPCAIKLIRPERAGDPQNLRRFEREVQATATLTNWHTVEIYDYGHTDDGTFYYVMEYLPGLTLEELVRRHGPLPPERVFHFLRQLAQALSEAHSIGLIHRDIKPGNVIVGERGGQPDVAKLLDFGLVSVASGQGDGDKLTQTGMLVGTPAYMSPEQAGDGADVDVRSDIYSLGAVAYYLLIGKPPFPRKTALQVLAAHLHERVPPLSSTVGSEAWNSRDLKSRPH